jgi:hypothetical protein
VNPEEAAAAAEERARQRRAAGEYAEAERLERLDPVRHPTLDQLREWAVIDVSPDVARSTRRGGGPITAFKRFLLRMLLQYHNELEAQTTRFNLHLLGHVGALEDRVDKLERRVRELEDGGGPRS